MDEAQQQVEALEIKNRFMTTRESDVALKEEALEDRKVKIDEETDYLGGVRSELENYRLSRKVEEEKLKHIREDVRRCENILEDKEKEFNTKNSTLMSRLEIINKQEEANQLEKSRLEKERSLLEKEKAELREKLLILEAKDRTLEQRAKRVTAILG